MALEMSSGDVDAATELLNQTLDANPANTKKRQHQDTVNLKRVELAVGKKEKKTVEKAHNYAQVFFFISAKLTPQLIHSATVI